jgi:plasmid stability protein
MEAVMGVSLSIKDVPEAIAARLRQRAQRNHRSLQRELMALVEEAVAEPAQPASAAGPATALRFGEPPAAYAQALSGPALGSALPPPDAGSDGLLAELDRIVEGSRWGDAPVLGRDPLHDRALARELDFDCREAELKLARAR